MKKPEFPIFTGNILLPRIIVAFIVVTFVAGAVILVSCSGQGTPFAPAPMSATGTGETALGVAANLNMAAGPGNITSLWAHTASDGKSYAYLGTFDEPFCSIDITGVHIVDISTPAQPVKAGFLPAPTGTRTNEVRVARIKTAYFDGDILAHSVEFCRGAADDQTIAPSAGIVLYDVTDPLKPQRLASQFSLNFEVHNLYIFQKGDRAFILIVRDDSDKDFHVVDITNPSVPVSIAERGLNDWLGPDTQQALGTVPVPFLHDVWVRSYPEDLPNPHYAGRTIAYLSYWDAGLILLDVTDPFNPLFLGHSDYLDPDPLTGLPPEGNSHAAVPTEDGSLVFMGDEDFSPFNNIFTIDTGDFNGEFRAIEARFTRRLSDVEGRKLSGRPVFIGTACNPAEIPPPPAQEGDLVALIENGGCAFDQKVGNAAQAGYAGAIIFAAADAPEQLISMSGSAEKGTIPAFFVTRPTAFSILGISPLSPPETSLPLPGTVGSLVTINALFDGWGYGRILDVSDPANITELGHYATPEVLIDPPPAGAHTMHNVIVKDRIAYISWYGDGIRVVDFSDPKAPREIAHFVDNERGSDFWGVFLFEHPDGNTYVMGSDRSTGLWIFQLLTF